MKALHRILLAGLACGALIGAFGVASAAAPPQVFSVVEGRDSATDRPVLVLVGKSLTKFKDYALTDPLGLRAPETPDLLLRTKSMIVLGLPPDLPAGTYDLGCTYGTTDSLSFSVRVGNGAPLPGAVDTGALSPALRTDLDDAATLDGHAPSWYADASNLSAGTLDPARYSAIADLAAEGKIGAAAGQVAAGDHDHDGRYYTKAESDASFAGLSSLGLTGTINDGANPVDWSRLKGVPAGLADGVDNDTTYAAGLNGGITFNATKISVLFAGTGTAASVARSDHDHDARYYTQAQLNATGGTLNAGTNPVDWTRLKGVPAGLADGADNDAWTTSGSDVYRASGRVVAGTGTFSSPATLQVGGTEGVLFGGSIGSGSIPATGGGTRMMWYPGKGAFRAGYVNAAKWDDASVGDYSVATGIDTTASGGTSTAMGNSTTASGYASTSMGYSTIATGSGSTAMGSGPTASGFASTAMGYYTAASGDYSTAMEYTTTASGFASTAMGYHTTAQDYASVVLGRFNVIPGGSATAWNATDTVLVVGNGTGTGANASNAFTLLKNGNLTIAGTLTQNSDERLKKDIAPLAGVLSKIGAIRGVTYCMKDPERGPDGKQIGLLAQEVRAVFPELVHEDSRGTLSVAYGSFSAVLLEAVKEQQVELDSREKEIATLKKELSETRSAMEARLARLETLLSGK